MPRTGADVRDGAPGRVAGLAARRPEWRGWLRLVEEAERALADAAWETAELVAGSPRPPAPSPGAPLLHGATLHVAGAALAGLLTRLLRTAGEAGSAEGEALAALDLDPSGAAAALEATLRADRRALATLAGGERGADGLAAVAGLAALPPLHAVWRAHEPRLPAAWPFGWCPLCGAHPTLVELRGLDRARLLRCGRCGGRWELPWLCCAFCAESDHRRLGSLVPEDDATRMVEACGSCGGYLKSLTALTPSPPAELLLRDLESVELDLVALERGYRRPAGPGFRPGVRVVAVAP